MGEKKKYYQLAKAAIKQIQSSKTKMLRWGEADPGIEELGDVFQHVLTKALEDDRSAIVRAFDKCELDIDNPFHWADLLQALCEIHFPASREGEKTKLTDAFLVQLHEDRMRFSGTQFEQARQMLNEPGSRYTSYNSVNSLRRVFPKAKHAFLRKDGWGGGTATKRG